MAFTPSNLYITNMGSVQCTIAKVNASITSGTNNWASGITDIVAIQCQSQEPYVSGSASALTASYTASNGTIWLTNPLHASGTPFTFFVYSGLVVKN